MNMHPFWEQVTILIRILFMLSFNDRLAVQKFLPELFHIIMCTVAVGSSGFRSTVYSLTVNIIHSLCTLGRIEESLFKSLSATLSEFAEPKVKFLFGLNRSSANAFALQNVDVDGEDISCNLLESLVMILLDVIQAFNSSTCKLKTWVPCRLSECFSDRKPLEGSLDVSSIALRIRHVRCRTAALVCGYRVPLQRPNG